MFRISLFLAYFIFQACPSAFAFNLGELLQNRLNPELKYRTIKTKHFEIHYPEHLEKVSSRFIGLAEKSHEKVTRTLKFTPAEKTHIVITDRSDNPNVYTFVFPHSQIFYEIGLPTQSVGIIDYQDIHDWHLTHEFTHSAELLMKGSPYKGLGSVFGSLSSPHMSMPLWLKEGLAVYTESTLTKKGRGGSSTYRMMMRAAYEEGLLGDSDFGKKDTIFSSENKIWPWNLRPYFFGYYLVRTISEKGQNAIPLMLKRQASTFPYNFQAGLKEVGFSSFDQLWNQTIDQIKKESQKDLSKIKKSQLTKLEYLTQTGQLYYGLALSPSGKTLLVTRDHPDFENAILRFSLNGDKIGQPRVLMKRTSGAQTSFSKFGPYIAFDQTSVAQRYNQVSDIFIYDLRKKKYVSVSPILHARDPDIHPDGKHLAYVANDKGKNYLLISDTLWENQKNILGEVGYSRISTPRFSPSGDALVFSLHNDVTGGEDLAIANLNTKENTYLIQDGSLNSHPSWSKDGKTIFYSSDRSGVFNIYAYDLEKKSSIQITNVSGGLFYPVVDEKHGWVYCTSYRGMGYDVARFKLPDPKFSFLKHQHETNPIIDHTLDEKISSQPIDWQPYKSVGYLKPQYLGPSLLLRPGTAQIGLQTGSVDPLFLTYYSAELRYDTATKLPVGHLFYYNGTHSNAYDINISHDSVRVEGFDQTYRLLSTSMALDIPLDEVANQVHLRPKIIANAIDFVGKSQEAGPGLELLYNSEFKEVGYNFSEYGNYLSFQLSHLFGLSSDLNDASSARLLWRHHLALPKPRHALHFTFDGKSFFSQDPGENRLFTIGGMASFPYEYRSGITLLGAPPNAFTSHHAAVGTILYTFSLADFQRGLIDLPMYLGRLSAGFQFQALAIDKDEIKGSGFPGSAGFALFQNITYGHIFEFQNQLGIYQGSKPIGSDTQVIFSISSSTP